MSAEGRPKQQSGAVERAVLLFTSIKAAGAVLDAKALAGIADDHELDEGELIDALAFLEATGLIALQTMVVVSNPKGGAV